jgi:hypothetical protein
MNGGFMRDANAWAEEIYKHIIMHQSYQRIGLTTSTEVISYLTRIIEQIREEKKETLKEQDAKELIKTSCL